MPELTIDGQKIEVAAGTTVLEAALSRGQVVPHYCYHPGLPIAGNCRMCLVEVEKAPKLMIACATQVADGMVVNTQNARVKKAQAAVMEFLLINHPLDCTICDEAGECRLQEYAVAHGQGKSRYQDPKVLLSKAIDIGRHVMLDQERCIQCSRCTRFCDEVTKTGELGFFQRSDHTIIGIYPGQRLDNAYSGNVVDICPVGALTLKEFRFKARVWYLRNTATVCTACARGCNVMVAVGRQREMWTTSGQFDDRIQRIVPRVNAQVNGHWMCDVGRMSYEPLAAAGRLDAARDAGGAPLEWEEAMRRAATTLAAPARAGRAAVLVSPRLTAETIFAWRSLLEQLGPAAFGVQRLVRGEDDELLIRADKGGNSRGAAWILGDAASEVGVHDAIRRGAIDALLVLDDPLDPADGPKLTPELRARVRELVYVGPFLRAGDTTPTLALPSCAWSEEDGTVVNFAGRVQSVRRCHLPRGEGRPAWRVARDIALAAGVELPPWQSAGDVLRSLAEAVAPFAGMTEGSIGLLGRDGGAPAAAGRTA